MDAPLSGDTGVSGTGSEVREPVETLYVDTLQVGCDGGGALGHPLVYLTMEKNGVVDCPYCGRRYILNQHVHSGH